MALSGLFFASRQPCCVTYGPRGPHLCPVRNLTLLGDAHPGSGLGSPCQGKEPHVLIWHVEKPPFLGPLTGREMPASSVCFCTDPDTRLLFSELFFIPLS